MQNSFVSLEWEKKLQHAAAQSLQHNAMTNNSFEYTIILESEMNEWINEQYCVCECVWESTTWLYHYYHTKIQQQSLIKNVNLHEFALLIRTEIPYIVW